MNNKILTILFVSLISFFNLYGSETIEEITLTVTAEGLTKDDATKNALREAIEQAYGCFVSSNTEILEDEIVKDEIITISSGSIKKFVELSDIIDNNNQHLTTLEVTVSVPGLIKYSQSKGSNCEFAGATFGQNLKLKELNKLNEERSISILLSKMELILKRGFDYELKMEDPTVNGDVVCIVNANINSQGKAALGELWKAINIIALSEKETSEYSRLKLPVFSLEVLEDAHNKEWDDRGWNNYIAQFYNFRSVNTAYMLYNFFAITYLNSLCNFSINSNLKTQSELNNLVVIPCVHSGPYIKPAFNLNYDIISTDNTTLIPRRISTPFIEYDGIKLIEIGPSHIRYNTLISQGGFFIEGRGSMASDIEILTFCQEGTLGYIKEIDRISLYPKVQLGQDILSNRGGTAVSLFNKAFLSDNHVIKLSMNIPLEDLTEITNFTILPK